MRSFLSQPYPFSDNTGHKLVLCAGIGAFIALFLGIFKPFGFDELQASLLWRNAFYFGLVTFVVSAFFQVLLPKFFPRLFKEEAWRSWKEIVYLLLTTCAIGAANYLLVLYLYPQALTLSGFFKSQLNTLEIGVFPVLFIVFLKQLTLYRRFVAEAKTVNSEIHQSEEPKSETILLPAAESKIILRGDNQNEELLLLPDDLLFIASADNYVNVHYREAGGLKSALLRGSLKKIEERLSGHPSFLRCHRMYVVNLQAVKDVTGNAQGLRLHLSGVEEPIPVSRSLTETVKERLHHLSRSPQNA